METHTRPRGPSETPDGVDPNIRRTRKTQRDGHNSGVKIWSLCSVSGTLSHATLEQPFRTLAIKWEVNIFLKKPSCVLHSCVFLHASLSLCRCELFYIYMCIYVDVNLHMWLYNTSCLTKAEEPSLPYYLPKAGGRIIGFIPFPRVLVIYEMQSVSSRIWTRVVVSISYNDNHYTTGT